MGRYCSYLLPKQAGGTPQILVDKTLRMTSRLRVYDLQQPCFQALLNFIYYGEMEGPLAERVESLARTLGVRWFSEDRAGSRRKRYRSPTPSPARNEDAEVSSNGDNDSGKSD